MLNFFNFEFELKFQEFELETNSIQDKGKFQPTTVVAQW